MGTGHDDERSMTSPGQPGGVPDSIAPETSGGKPLGAIALRQVRVNRTDVQYDSQDANPMNRLVPYLDLYCRLNDDELARLAVVPVSVVGNLRRQVVQVDRALTRFTDLLPRLTDAEMVRLTGATQKTVRFWRLCQPRVRPTGPEADGWSVAQAAETLGRAPAPVETPLDSGAPIEQRHPSGEMSRHPSGETLRHSTGENPRIKDANRQYVADKRVTESGRHYIGDGRVTESGRHYVGEPTAAGRKHPSGETRAGSAPYRMPTAERDGGSSARRLPQAPRRTGTQVMSSVAPVDLSRPQTVEPKTEEHESDTADSDEVVPPEMRLKQQAVAEQMEFSGAPFPGNDAEASGAIREDDGIFIGLELPEPRHFSPPGQHD